jgi:uncharacterized protein (UPF0305 family)
VDWSALLNTILIPGLIGLGGLVVWLVKFYIPAMEKRKDAELEARLENQKDRREHVQASENVAIEVLREIIRESIQEHSQESQEMRNIISRLGRQVDNNTQAARTLAGVISEKD